MNPRSLIASLHDLCAAAVAWIVGYALRFNFDIPPNFADAMLRNLLWIIPLQAAGTVALAIPALLLMLHV